MLLFRKVLFLICTYTLLVNTATAGNRLTHGHDIERKRQNDRANSNSKIKYRITKVLSKYYCYDIYVNDKMLIHQISIPGLPGNTGFKSRRSARNVARLVIWKIREGYMPPTVTIPELKKLKVIK